MKDALAIQDRFASEPVFAKTGKGYVKSGGTKGNALSPQGKGSLAPQGARGEHQRVPRPRGTLKRTLGTGLPRELVVMRCRRNA